MNELSDAIQCLCNSPQRLQILNELDNTYLDLRSLMTELESPRSTLQRNLSILEERGWIEDTQDGYTVTTAGTLICEEVAAVNETVKTITDIAPFLSTIDASSPLDISQLRDLTMTVPSSLQPNAPMKRLVDAFDGANHVRGCLPAISWVLVERFRHIPTDVISTHEYIISRSAFDTLRTHDTPNNGDTSEMNYINHSDLYICTDEIPFGLFIDEDRLALVAYTANGRIHALIESVNEITIEWGKQIYDQYKQQSKPVYEDALR